MADEMTLDGATQVLQAIEAAVRAQTSAAAVALNEIAETTMTDAKEHTPVEFGVLKASGKVHEHATPQSLTARLSFGTEYAIYVHERLELHHDVGEAKFLEHAVNRTAATFEKDVAARMASIAGTGAR